MSKSRADVTDLFRAIRFAAEKHRDDRRKGKIGAPYINHPIMVAEQLAAAGPGTDIELLMAAVLHDVVEDTDASVGELRDIFGERVAGIVSEVTDDKALTRRERKIQSVHQIAGKSTEARLVKLCDLIANVHDVIHHPPHWSDQQKLDYLSWGEHVVANLKGMHPQLESKFTGLVSEARARLTGQ